MTLLAYPEGQPQKDALIAQIHQHRIKDQLVKGIYWEGGKGCAIGCSLHASYHPIGELRYGIPITLWYLDDSIFENLPNGEAMLWPERFAAAFIPGRDYSIVEWRFLHWLLSTNDVMPKANYTGAKDILRISIELLDKLANGVKVPAEYIAEQRQLQRMAAAHLAAIKADDQATIAAFVILDAAWGAAAAAAETSNEREMVKYNSDFLLMAVTAWEHGFNFLIKAAWSVARSMEGIAAVSGAASWSMMADKLISLIEAV